MDVFVFGSNLAGRHGKGSALEARKKWGAIDGKGVGMQGVGLEGSSYAIPTKDEKLNPLSLHIIEAYIDDFREYAISHRDLKFTMVQVGCGLAGYTPAQIMPYCRNMPKNVTLPFGWRS